MLSSFNATERYLVVTPTLSEVDRIIRDSNVDFVQPTNTGQYDTKADSLGELLRCGLNIATTHELYLSIAHHCKAGLLDHYHIWIDEVPTPLHMLEGPKPTSWEQFYLGNGYATVDADGRVRATDRWDAHCEDVDDTLSMGLYKAAKAECLFVVNNSFFLWTIPPILFTSGASMTVMTYRAGGSLLKAYLDKLGISYHHDTDQTQEAEFKSRARSLITVEDIPGLSNIRFSHSQQTANSKGKAERERRVSTALANLRQRRLSEVSARDVMVTCAKRNWWHNGDSTGTQRRRPRASGYSRGSRIFDATWVSNQTRGTNDHIHCSHLIYLWDQNVNPAFLAFLGVGSDYNDSYALAELIQWIYRSRVRRGEPITLFLPSRRMRDLFEAWLIAD
jgi:hypothetical protein